ncbi:MAG: CPBP family intramembrane glutamic endopeptidase [Chloroflexota bacterium]
MKPLRKIAIFFIATFLMTILLSGVQQWLRLRPELISLPQFGPAAAAVLMMLAFRQDCISLNLAVHKDHLQKYLIALVIPALVPLILWFTYSRLIGPVTFPAVHLPSFALLLVGIMLGAFGEELGWRGYAQTLLERTLSPFVSTLLIGAVWGLWHVGNFQHGAVHMLFFVLFTVSVSVFMRWLLVGTHYSVIVATLVHFSINASAYLLRDVLIDTRVVILNSSVWLCIGIVVFVLNRPVFLSARKGQLVLH